MSKHPLITVLLPSYNYENYLDQSIQSFLSQDYAHKELICIDDGSSDGSIEKIQKWRASFPSMIRLLTHPRGQHLGIVETYRRGIKEARGELVGFIEADDLWSPGNLSSKIDLLERHPAAGVCFSAYHPFGTWGGSLYWSLYGAACQTFLPRTTPYEALSELLERNPAASFSNFIVRRDLLDQIPPPHAGELFYDWWLLAHLASRAPFIFHPGRLWKWRIHKQSANYRRFGIQDLKDLQDFLLRLYHSLDGWIDSGSGANTRAKRLLARARLRMLRYRDVLQTPQSPRNLLILGSHPVRTARFLLHIGLRNLLL